MATHSSVLAWRIPGTGEPGGLPSMGSHRVGHDWSDLAAAAYSDILITNFSYNFEYYIYCIMLLYKLLYNSYISFKLGTEISILFSEWSMLEYVASKMNGKKTVSNGKSQEAKFPGSQVQKMVQSPQFMMWRALSNLLCIFSVWRIWLSGKESPWDIFSEIWTE